MSYDLTEVRITGRTSAHNAPRDDADRAAWNELMDEVERLAKRPEYARLDLQLDLPRLDISGCGYR